MSIPGSALPLLLASPAGAAAGYEIERSLRFNSADSAYLSRTPSTAGNRKTWTWAGWVKRSELGAYYPAIFAEYSSIADQGVALTFIYNTDKLQLWDYATSSADWSVVTAQVFRDPSAWYHLVIAVDTTQATASDRVKIYVNGNLATLESATYPSQNLDTRFNRAQATAIGRYGAANSGYLPAYLADIHFIDGQALDPTDFGEFDATTGVWNPIEYAGTFPGNSFHLDFADNSSAAALGYDAAGSNDWTVNNLTVASSSPGVKFDGYLDYVTVASSSDFEFGSGDFTVEFFTLTTGHPGTTTWISRDNWNGGAGGAPWVIYYYGGGIYFSVTQTAGSWAIAGAGGVSYSNNVLHHVAFVRSGNSFDLYLDGIKGTTGTFSGSIEASSDPLFIGAYSSGYNGGVNGYISNMRIVKGTALYTTNFTPPTAPLTNITNTKLLCFQSSTSVTDAAVTPGTITAFGDVYATYIFGPSSIDSLRDSPTNGDTANDTGLGGELAGNYATWNPLYKSVNAGSYTYGQGNLELTAYSGSTLATVASTIATSNSGKYYVEISSNGTVARLFGFYPASELGLQNEESYGVAQSANSFTYNQTGGTILSGTTTIVTGLTAGSAGDIVGIALDLDNGRAWFSNNGTWLQGDPATNSNPPVTFTAGQYNYIFGASIRGGSNIIANFGQRAFAYSAPSGYKCLCTANLDTPTIEDPSTVMDVALDTGANILTSTKALCGGNANFLWIKDRANGSTNHHLIDIVRDPQLDGTPFLASNSGSAEATLGSYSAPSGNSVGWAWYAGTSNATNTSGTITSTVRANISAGFSVVTYTGTYTASTVGHGLGVAPQMIIIKDRTFGYNWQVYHHSIGNSNGLLLNTTDAAQPLSSWNNTSPTSSVFSLGAVVGVNNSGAGHVAYCFAPVESYSAFGSYTGNGSTDGPFVYTGFRPKYLMQKKTSGPGEWVIWDSSRRSYNWQGPYLLAESSVAENAGSEFVDFLSNGFKLRTTNPTLNESSATSIYIAFAESPFQYARAR